jgi:hypothetical protein
MAQAGKGPAFRASLECGQELCRAGNRARCVSPARPTNATRGKRLRAHNIPLQSGGGKEG